jgi:hypothetical protein
MHGTEKLGFEKGDYTLKSGFEILFISEIIIASKLSKDFILSICSY